MNFANELSVTLPEIQGVILLAGLGVASIDVTVLRQFKALAENLSLPPDDRENYIKLYEQGTSFFSRVRKNEAPEMESYIGNYSRFWGDWIRITESSIDTVGKMKVPGLLL